MQLTEHFSKEEFEKRDPLPSSRIMALVCGLPHEARQRKLMLMLQGFMDDSGSKGNNVPYVLGGYILEAPKWAAFADDWHDELQKEPRIQYFKLREAIAGDGQFSSISEEFRNCKIRDLLGVIKRHKPNGIWTCVSWENWRRLLGSTMVGAWTHPYPLLFHLLFDVVAEFEKERNIYPSKIDLDFDEQGKLGNLAIFLYPYFKARSQHREIFGRTPTLLDDKAIMPLQAADLLAGAIRMHLEPGPRHPRFGWVSQEVLNTCWGFFEYEPKMTMTTKRRIAELRQKATKTELDTFLDNLSAIVKVPRREIEAKLVRGKKKRKRKI